MALQQSAGSGAVTVTRVIAAAELVGDEEKRAFLHQIPERERVEDPQHLARLGEDLLSPDRYDLRVHLSAELSDGRVVHSPGMDLGLAGRRRGAGAIYHRYRGFRWWPSFVMNRILRNYHVQPHDIEDHINDSLGRLPRKAPDFPSSPTVGWANLIESLLAQGLVVTADDLVAAPMRIEFAPEVQSNLFDQS